MATVIPTTYAQGDVPTAAQFNAPNKAIVGLGTPDDNNGSPWLARSLGIPVPVRGSDPNLAAKAIPANGSYVVPAGQWFVVRYIGVGNTTVGGITVTPSGGSGFTAVSNVLLYQPLPLVLGPGDAISTGQSSTVLGFSMSAPADAAAGTTVVTNTATYTVPANSLAYLVAAVSPGTIVQLVVDSVAGPPPAPLAASSGTPVGAIVPTVPFKAGQVLASSSTTGILLSVIVMAA
jgi:hypothetical protein